LSPKLNGITTIRPNGINSIHWEHEDSEKIEKIYQRQVNINKILK